MTSDDASSTPHSNVKVMMLRGVQLATSSLSEPVQRTPAQMHRPPTHIQPGYVTSLWNSVRCCPCRDRPPTEQLSRAQCHCWPAEPTTAVGGVQLRWALRALSAQARKSLSYRIGRRSFSDRPTDRKFCTTDCRWSSNTPPASHFLSLSSSNGSWAVIMVWWNFRQPSTYIYKHNKNMKKISQTMWSFSSSFLFGFVCWLALSF